MESFFQLFFTSVFSDFWILGCRYDYRLSCIRFLKNLWRNVKATGLYFLFGIILSALFQRYIPQEALTALFGGNEAWGVLMMATLEPSV